MTHGETTSSPAGSRPAHALFQAVSDPTRLRLLRLLQREELNVQELVDILGMGQPRVSKHLAVLRDAGWVTQRREGTWSWHAAVGVDEFPGGAALHAAVLAAAGGVDGARLDDAALARVLRGRDERARDFFSGEAARWDEIRRVCERPELHWAAVAALVPPGLRVVDIGTGTGALLPLLAEAGCRVTAVDRSAEMLARARELCRRHELLDVAFEQADVQALPLVDGAFDAAFGSMVLRHVARPARALAEMARVVRPGGRVVLLDFTRHDQSWMRDELAHQWLGFERAEIERLLRQAGLRPLAYQARPIAWPPAPAASARPAARRRAGAGVWPDVFLAVAARPPAGGAADLSPGGPGRSRPADQDQPREDT